jgi:hypothetical protein
MAKITRFFEDVDITAAGLEIQNIIGGIKFLHTGTIEQIIIEDATASATEVDVEVRYISDNSERHNLVYLFEAGDMPLFVDSEIAACFSLKNSKEVDGDLHLFIEPDIAGTFNIRVDFNINNLSGL